MIKFVEGLLKGRLLFLNNNSNNGLNGNNNLNNNGRFVGIEQLFLLGLCIMINSTVSFFDELCHYDNLYAAYWKARQGKTQRKYVLDFEKKLPENLLLLQQDLQFQTYHPKPLQTFILRDPKTRKISKSEFRDRVVHHALCNIIEPLLEKHFIYDSYANRKKKGTLKAIGRFDTFKRKVSHNNTRTCFVLKADIRQYFETVDHSILLSILKKKINDEKIFHLITVILNNYSSGELNKGMPLGNLTSQFFANVYLNELDQFIKHTLKAHFYIRYVDDFVILHHDRKMLEEYLFCINQFLQEQLSLQIHPEKSGILRLDQGILFLGFRIFYHHKLIRRKNILKFWQKYQHLKESYSQGLLDREKAIESLGGWLAYVSYANTYKYRRKLLQDFDISFPLSQPFVITPILKQKNIIRKIEESRVQFTAQKTKQLFVKGISISGIAASRGIRESTVWSHLANLIEHHQLSLWKVLPQEKIMLIRLAIKNENDTLKEIKSRIYYQTINYDEINCVLADIKRRKRRGTSNSS